MADDPITAVLDTLAARADTLDQAATRLAALASDLDHRITICSARLDKVMPPADPGWDDLGDAPRIPPPRRWWKLAGKDRDDAIAELRSWIEQVYRPGYGHLAATLAPCWDQHPLCLYALDIAAELWSVLYLTGIRPAAVLSAQAEYQVRVLPGAGRPDGRRNQPLPPPPRPVPPRHSTSQENPHDHPQRTQLLATALAYPATSSRRRTPPARQSATVRSGPSTHPRQLSHDTQRRPARTRGPADW
jgi:hypothetical protein